MGIGSNAHLKHSRAVGTSSAYACSVLNLVEAFLVVRKIDEIVPVVELDIQHVQHGKSQRSRNFDPHVVARITEVERHQVAPLLLKSSESQHDFSRRID